MSRNRKEILNIPICEHEHIIRTTSLKPLHSKLHVENFSLNHDYDIVILYIIYQA